MRPLVFIGSSTEGLPVVRALEERLAQHVDTQPWEGFFPISATTRDHLVTALPRVDFAIFVLSGEDLTLIRGERVHVARDNVIFELGLATGILGPGRVFLVVPDDLPSFHLPTDLLGVVTARYSVAALRDNPVAALTRADTAIRSAMANCRRRQRTEQTVLLARYDGPSSYYPAAREMLERQCVTIVLIQESSSLVLGPAAGGRDETLFADAVVRQANEGAVFYHVTSLSGLRQHVVSTKRSYGEVGVRLDRRGVETQDVRIDHRQPTPGQSPSFRYYGDTPSLDHAVAPALLVEYATGEFEGLVIAHIGNSVSCFHLAGGDLTQLIERCKEFYHDCDVLTWAHLAFLPEPLRGENS